MNKVIFFVFVFVLAGVHATASGCKDNAGNEFADGSSFPTADGCGRCFCQDGGIGCVDLSCHKDQVCVHNGIGYMEGDFYQIDCNMCRCLYTGDGFCPFLERCPSKVCKTEDGKMYAVGEQFLATDGCNRCTSTENGSATCTRMTCVPAAIL